MPIGMNTNNLTLMNQRLQRMQQKTSGKNPIRNLQNTKIPNEEKSTQPSDKALVDKFKQLDTDGDMHISKKELVDSTIKEYIKNGYELKEGSIDDILADIANNVKEFGGEDGQLNIDEYRTMVEAQLKKIETHQAKIDEITKMKEESQNNDTKPPEKNSAGYSGTVTGTVTYTSDIYTNGIITDKIENKQEVNVPYEEEIKDL